MTQRKYERLLDLAAQFVHLKLDLIMARGEPGATAGKRATTTVPIVRWGATDPIAIGLVQSLAPLQRQDLDPLRGDLVAPERVVGPHGFGLAAGLIDLLLVWGIVRGLRDLLGCGR